MLYYKLKMRQRIQLSNHKEALERKGGSPIILAQLTEEIHSINQLLEKLMDKIYRLITQDETLALKYKNILSIDGVGKVSAIVLLHLFIRYPDANQREIVSRAGLDPIIRGSDTSVKGKSRISKAGARIYRGSLFMATMSATRYNAQMKTFYERLKANGKHTTSAQIAVMRKLVVVAHSLFKSGQMYDKEMFLKSTGGQKMTA